jgi:hypothetical protein
MDIISLEERGAAIGRQCRYTCRRPIPISAEAASIVIRLSARSTITLSQDSSRRLTSHATPAAPVTNAPSDISIGEASDISVGDLHALSAQDRNVTPRAK